MDYAKLASSETVQKTIKALGENNIEGVVVDTKEEALEKIKEWSIRNERLFSYLGANWIY